MMMPKEVNALVEELHKLGVRPYIVGGALRDLLLGMVPLDYDIAFKGNLDLLETIAKNYHTSRIDRIHGTLSMHFLEMKVEISLFRKEESYTDARHPLEISFNAELEEDLLRRDFVLNSMAYDCSTKEIVDPFKAREDLGKRPIDIRTTRPAAISFQEDALRMIRALRLFGRVSLVRQAEFSQEIKQALCSFRSQISLLRKEVVHRELLKIWNESNTGDTFSCIADLDVFQLIFPAIWGQQISTDMSCLNGHQPFTMKLAQFASCVGIPPMILYDGLGYNKKYWKKAEKMYHATRLLGGDAIELAKTELSNLDEKERRLVCRLYTQFYAKKTPLYVRICEKHEAITVYDLDIGAKELIALGLRKEQIGSGLRWLLQQVYLDESLNERDKLIQLLLERGK